MRHDLRRLEAAAESSEDEEDGRADALLAESAPEPPPPGSAPALDAARFPAHLDGYTGLTAGGGPVLEATAPTVDIFYGSDREPEAVLGGYGARRGHGLRLGVAKVSVPARRKRGAVTRPLKVFSITLTREDPRKHFILQDAQELEPTAFQARLREAAEAASTRPALLFVHGFNTPFDGALYRAAQLAVDLAVTGPMLAYSWPSAGEPATYNKGIAYDYDRESVRQARDHFMAYLDLILASGVARLNILAHSLGNDLLLETLKDRSHAGLSAVRQVVLASPDVDCDVAAVLAPKISPKVKGMTLYACDKDIALRVSKDKAGGMPRAGELMGDGYPLIVSGMDSIDASACTLRLAEFNHNSFVADTVLRHDLAKLLSSGRRPPDERSASITPGSCPRGEFWRLQPRSG